MADIERVKIFIHFNIGSPNEKISWTHILQSMCSTCPPFYQCSIHQSLWHSSKYCMPMFLMFHTLSPSSLLNPVIIQVCSGGIQAVNTPGSVKESDWDYHTGIKGSYRIQTFGIKNDFLLLQVTFICISFVILTISIARLLTKIFVLFPEKQTWTDRYYGSKSVTLRTKAVWSARTFSEREVSNESFPTYSAPVYFKWLKPKYTLVSYVFVMNFVPAFKYVLRLLNCSYADKSQAFPGSAEICISFRSKAVIKSEWAVYFCFSLKSNPLQTDSSKKYTMVWFPKVKWTCIYFNQQ